MIRSEPKLRFKGFVKSWRMVRLDDVVTFSKGKGYSKKDIKSNGDPLLLYGSLYTDYKTIISTVETFSDLKSGSVVSKGNEVVVPSSGETRLDIARASAIVAPGIIIGGDLNVLQPESFISPVYLALNLNSKKSKKELVKKAQGSSVVHLYNEDLKSVTIDFPSIEEQKKIGEFFKLLDARIANQKRKIEKIKALKQAYLTEMFPQEGEDVPKLRFEGFSKKWKEERLASVILFESKGKVKATLKGGNTPYLETSYLNGGTPTYVNADKDVECDDVLILWDGSNAGTVYHGFEGALGSTLKVYKPKNSGAYLYYFLKKNQKVIYTQYRTPNIPHVINTFTEEFKVMLPEKEEQQKIGEFFKTLDEKIEAEEKKLEKLKKMKEAFLEEMFV